MGAKLDVTSRFTFLDMLARRAFVLLFAATGTGLVGCGMLNLEDATVGDGGFVVGGSTQTQTGGSGGAADAGIDAELGDGSVEGPLSYAALCGTGCLPGVDAAPCALGAAGAGGTGGQDENALGDCRLELDDASNSLQGTCGPTGASNEGEPCASNADCAPGLACVVDNIAVCRSYCCGDLEACPSGTFCQPMPVPETTADAELALRVPVCVPATTCTLLDDTACGEDEICAIVRVDGTTSCVEPGTGKLDDPCPCAEGFVCATADNRCLQLCRTGRSGDCPDDYSCQGGSTMYPQGYGVCVGG